MKRIIGLICALVLMMTPIMMQAPVETVTKKRIALGVCATLCAAATAGAIAIHQGPTAYTHALFYGQYKLGTNDRVSPWRDRITCGIFALGIPTFVLAAAVVT